MMKIYVGITDETWFEYLKSQRPDEVNFWRPLARTEFKAIKSGDLFLFKLHFPNNYIVGGGTFLSYTRLPLATAWETFGQKNGAPNIEIFQAAINKYRDSRGLPEELNPSIGCIVLNNPVLLERSDWLPAPQDWSSNIVQGKTYDTDDAIGASLLKSIQPYLLSFTSNLDKDKKIVEIPHGYRSQQHENDLPQLEENNRYSSPYLTRARLGQWGFRTLMIKAYEGRCAITGEQTLPTLQAAHIKPFVFAGPHRVDNGLLLRADLHILFDQGYITITPEYRITVSQRLRTEFGSDNKYQLLNGQSLVVLPQNPNERPALEFIEWHNKMFSELNINKI